MGDQYGPNDREPCGSKSAKITHLAHGEDCETCGTNRLGDTPDRGGSEEVVLR